MAVYSIQMSNNVLYAEIAVRYAVDKLFTYRVPERLEEKELPGRRVLVPFGQKIITGYVIHISHKTTVSDPKTLIDLLDDRPILSGPLLALARWMAGYYSAPLGRVIQTMLPAGIEVESRAMVRPADGFEHETLDCITANEAVSLDHLRKKIGIARVKRLLDQGRINIEHQLSPPKVRRKNIVYIKLACPGEETSAALGDKAPKQVEIIQKLIDLQGEAPQSLLGSSAALKSLEKKGFIVREERRSLRIPFSASLEEETDPNENEQNEKGKA